MQTACSHADCLLACRLSGPWSPVGHARQARVTARLGVSQPSRGTSLAFKRASPLGGPLPLVGSLSLAAALWGRRGPLSCRHRAQTRARGQDMRLWWRSARGADELRITARQPGRRVSIMLRWHALLLCEPATAASPPSPRAGPRCTRACRFRKCKDARCYEISANQTRTFRQLALFRNATSFLSKV